MGDFTDALAALVGKAAPGLSAPTVSRLKTDWEKDFQDWQFTVESEGWPGSQYEDRSFFRAYTGDVTTCTDDCVYMDLDQTWQEPFKNKGLIPREDPFYVRFNKQPNS